MAPWKYWKISIKINNPGFEGEQQACICLLFLFVPLTKPPDQFAKSISLGNLITMIQRVQSIWLFGVAACAFCSYLLPLYEGHLQDNSKKSFFIPDSFLLFPLIFGLGLLALICIFLFKKRNLQFRLTIFGLLFSILAIVLEYIKSADFKTVNNFISGSYHFGALIPFAMGFFFIMAARGIYKDEKLVKSMDKLR
jgi:hypothetical protein